jgi:hypothetical protein
MLSIIGTLAISKPTELPAAGDGELKVLPPAAEKFFEAPTVELTLTSRPDAGSEAEKNESPPAPERLSVVPRQVAPENQ